MWLRRIRRGGAVSIKNVLRHLGELPACENPYYRCRARPVRAPLHQRGWPGRFGGFISQGRLGHRVKRAANNVSV
jgi:hypothetical protein